MSEFQKAWQEFQKALEEFRDLFIEHFKIDKILNWIEKKCRRYKTK